MKIFNLLIAICLSIPAYSQSFNLKGKIIDEQKESIPFANIAHLILSLILKLTRLKMDAGLLQLCQTFI